MSLSGGVEVYTLIYSMKKFQPQPVPKSALYKSITSKIIKLESWNYGQIEALIMQIIKLM